MSIYKVWFPFDGETEDDAKDVEAYSYENAAEKETEHRDSDEPSFDSFIFVAVRDPSGVMRKCQVYPEASVDYHAIDDWDADIKCCQEYRLSIHSHVEGNMWKCTKCGNVKEWRP